MNTRFCLRPYDKVVSEKLEHAGILRPIARALSARGVKSSDDLLEDWTALLPPASLQGTQQAAVSSGERHPKQQAHHGCCRLRL